MNLYPKLWAGNFLSGVYNTVIGRCPIELLRTAFLNSYLKSFGSKNRIARKCTFMNGRKVIIGNNNQINSGCVFDGRIHKITIGNHVSIGPKATVLTLGHDPQSSAFENKGGNVCIKDRAWIAYGAIILPGVTIGTGAVVGAGAVVTKDVNDFEIVAGNPAKKIGNRNKDLNYEFGA